jgi:murein L,D-transpeptidase YcbB/YkuD
VRAFQASRGLQANGQIDDETLNALGLNQGQ